MFKVENCVVENKLYLLSCTYVWDIDLSTSVCRHDTFLPSSPQISNSNSPALPPNRYAWGFFTIDIKCVFRYLGEICCLWLRLETLVQLCRKTVGDNLCLISSSVSRCYQSRLLYFLWRPDWEWLFCRGIRGSYKSLNDCCQCSVGCTDFSGFSLQGLPTCAGHRMAMEEAH